jgi:exopolyphosphatase/guanosine-5'-triphosphate,3'-diphosphate pyrophosphatase
MSRAKGRLDLGHPVGVIDIGSNSVRLVVYEGLARSPSPIFNEKVLCGLGREVRSTGRLPADSMDRALAALRRFRTLAATMRARDLYVVATAACREASNGRDFIARAAEACGCRIEVLSGQREARLSAYGVLSGIHQPDGIVGDLGGGSIELVSVRGTRLTGGVTLPLGGLALQDAAQRSIKRADAIVAEALAHAPVLRSLRGRSFYAVGGTWRALGRLHIWQTGYPLHVMHGYEIPAREAMEFARLVRRVNPETLSQIEVVAEQRRPLLAYAALVLEHLLRVGKPKNVIISASGVREGLLYAALGAGERRQDGLLAAANDLNLLRSRSPQHGEELIVWSDRFMTSSGIEESAEEKRLRHAACLLADISWRAHPDYRGEQSSDIIAHGNFNGVDHAGRTFLALAVYFRYMGLIEDELPPRLRELASTRLLDRARVLGASMRVAYLVSASMPAVLPNTPMRVVRGKLALQLKGKYTPLASDRLFNRLRQLARLVGREPVFVTD